jgi:hypothetical protein
VIVISGSEVRTLFVIRYQPNVDMPRLGCPNLCDTAAVDESFGFGTSWPRGIALPPKGGAIGDEAKPWCRPLKHFHYGSYCSDRPDHDIASPFAAIEPNEIDHRSDILGLAIGAADSRSIVWAAITNLLEAEA